MTHHHPTPAKITMPAMDFATFAREQHLPPEALADHADHVVIFTGASAKKAEIARAIHQRILQAADMRNPEAAESQMFALSATSSYVGGVIVPREQLGTCMRGAEIDMVADMPNLRGKLAKAVKARLEEYHTITQVQPVSTPAPSEQTGERNAIMRFLSRLETPNTRK